MTGGGGPEITKEMMIDNAVAGSVIGKSGSKVGEISKISGAQVHISTEDEMTPGGERVVTMSGTPESVLLAEFLVQSNIDLYKRDRDMERVLDLVDLSTVLSRMRPSGIIQKL